MLLIGDCLKLLPTLPAESIQTCVTSPPYFRLRDYGVDGQHGMEATPEDFVANLVAVFREVRRVLRSDGTLWLNLGDSYNSIGGGYNDHGESSTISGSARSATIKGQRREYAGMKPKDLMGIPWMTAFALRADGWYLRQEIIWSKPNPMPESVTDRCAKTHEHLFLLSKSPRYYFDADAIKEPLAASSVARMAQDIENQAESTRANGGSRPDRPMKTVGGKPKGNRKTFRGGGVYTQGRSIDNDAEPCNDSVGNEPNEAGARNKRSVWTVATVPYKEAHYATFPPALIRPCILAGSRPGDPVLDPYMGSGTTAEVCEALARPWVGIDLNGTSEGFLSRRLSRTQSGLALA